MSIHSDDEQSSLTPTSIDLAGRHRLRIQRTRGHGVPDTVELVGHEGAVIFALEFGDGRPLLRFEGRGLTLQASGELSFEAEKIMLRSTRSLEIESGGDLQIRVAGDMHSVARAQRIEATLGDVGIEANDDVRIDGERVLVNC